MYEHVIKNVGGMRFLGHVNSFDYKYFRKAVGEGAVDSSPPSYVQEFRDVHKLAHRAVKVPITGPYTLVDWSYNEYYQAKGNEGSSLKERKMSARRDFLLDLVEKVIRPEIRDLVDAGASWIQIDEPALTTHPERAELEMFVEAWNETVRGFNCKFSDHTCYPNEVGYRLLAEYTPELEKCSQLTLEFANRDSPELGIDGGAREGYQALRYFVDNGYDGEFGIGAIHVHDYTGVAPKQSGLVSGLVIMLVLSSVVLLRRHCCVGRGLMLCRRLLVGIRRWLMFFRVCLICCLLVLTIFSLYTVIPLAPLLTATR